MTTVLEQMLSEYEINSIEDEQNAIKEILQELILAALSKAGFFKNAIFCGGTALRVFYNLNRFSEDLDFSLETPNPKYDIDEYLPPVVESLKDYGINLEIQTKPKKSAVQSAFLKVNTAEQLLLFNTEFDIDGVHKKEKIKIKLEVDTNPPLGGTYEMKAALVPDVYYVKIYDRESLFAGKIHSLLCRFWDNRVKGRDLYDFIFYVSKKTRINIKFLENAMKQSGHLKENESLDIEKIKSLLKQKFNEIDYKFAKEDVLPFVKSKSSLDTWDKNLFISIVDMIQE